MYGLNLKASTLNLDGSLRTPPPKQDGSHPCIAGGGEEVAAGHRQPRAKLGAAVRQRMLGPWRGWPEGRKWCIRASYAPLAVAAAGETSMADRGIGLRGGIWVCG